jgi:hypothetical protein
VFERFSLLFRCFLGVHCGALCLIAVQEWVALAWVVLILRLSANFAFFPAWVGSDPVSVHS